MTSIYCDRRSVYATSVVAMTVPKFMQQRALMMVFFDDDEIRANDGHSDFLSVDFGIDDCPAGLNDCAGGKAGRLQAPVSHDMENGLFRRNKVVRDDAAVTAPPYGFRTHYRAAPFLPHVDQMIKTSTKRV